MIFGFCFQYYGLHGCIYHMTIIYNGYDVQSMKYIPIYAIFRAANSPLIGKWDLIFEYCELEGQLLKISLLLTLTCLCFIQYLQLVWYH